jgi:AmpD protein
LQVSAHILIKRDGDIIQFVPFDKRAWHAGESSFQGRTACNDFSIGIELQGTDTIPYEPEQYQSLQQVLKILKTSYPIKHIVGHNEISPKRKTDPGTSFNWQMIE